MATIQRLGIGRFHCIVIMYSNSCVCTSQAINTCSQGMDREFIEELLLYLQQQRLQLDDSGRLLGRLEHSQDIPAVSHITVTHHTGAQDDEVSTVNWNLVNRNFRK